MIGHPTERHHLTLMRSHEWKTTDGIGEVVCSVCGLLFIEQIPLMWMVECPGPKFRLTYVGDKPEESPMPDGGPHPNGEFE